LLILRTPGSRTQAFLCGGLSCAAHQWHGGHLLKLLYVKEPVFITEHVVRIHMEVTIFPPYNAVYHPMPFDLSFASTHAIAIE